MMASNANKVLTFPLSLVLNVIDIGRGVEWGGAGSERGRDPKGRMFADEPPCRAGRKRHAEGCRRREAGETMAASWTVGVLASIAGRRDGGGGRSAAVVLPIVCCSPWARSESGCW